MGYKLLFCGPIIALLSTNITLLLTNNCWHCCRQLIFSKPGRRDLLATRQHPRPSRSSSFQAFEAICGYLLVISLDFYFGFSSDIISGKLFSCFLSKKGERVYHMCQFVNCLSCFVAIQRPLWQVWQKGLYWVKLAWRDVKRLNFAYSADHTFPGSVNFQQSRYIQFTLNPSHYPKKYPTTFSPSMSKRLHWHSTFSNLKSRLYGSAAVSTYHPHARNFPRIGYQQGY